MAVIARCACGAEWHQRGNQSGHCSACHRTFSSNHAFDLHRRVDHCVDPATLTKHDGSPILVARVDRTGTPQWGQPGSRPEEAA